MNGFRTASIMVWLTAFLSGTTMGLSIDLVTVGSPGNAPDTRIMSDGTTGYGSVAYTFAIGTFEVTAGQYCEFLNAVARTDTYGLYNASMNYDASPQDRGCNITRSGSSGHYSYTVAADWANRPVNYVSWGDVARFANWLHNGQPAGDQDASTTEDGSYTLNGAITDAALLAAHRTPNATWVLPSEDEWYKAAFYDPRNSLYCSYPTGTNGVPSNDAVDPDPGNNGNFYQDGSSIGSPYWRTPVGSFRNSRSHYGTFDQGGNVWEWNEAVVSGSFLGRGLRGGSFLDGDDSLHASYRGNYDPPSETTYAEGFRLVLLPEPATLCLLALGGVALLRRST